MECIRINLEKTSVYKPELSGIKRSESLETYRGQRSNLLRDYISVTSEEDKIQGSEVMCNNDGSRSISYEHFISQQKSWYCSLGDINQWDAGKIGKDKLSTEGEKKVFLAESNLRQEVILKKQGHVFEVLAKGTRFMKSIDFPTVIVKLREGHLRKSTIYPFIIQPESEEYAMAIPCLVFSCPYGHTKTQFAELLPL